MRERNIKERDLLEQAMDTAELPNPITLLNQTGVDFGRSIRDLVHVETELFHLGIHVLNIFLHLQGAEDRGVSSSASEKQGGKSKITVLMVSVALMNLL